MKKWHTGNTAVPRNIVSLLKRDIWQESVSTPQLLSLIIPVYLLSFWRTTWVRLNIDIRMFIVLGIWKIF